jgi:hypothetical protein
MGAKTEKKFRRSIRKRINDMSMMALKKEIFRLARNRDILGIVAIAEGVALAIFIYLAFR